MSGIALCGDLCLPEALAPAAARSEREDGDLRDRGPVHGALERGRLPGRSGISADPEGGLRFGPGGLDGEGVGPRVGGHRPSEALHEARRHEPRGPQPLDLVHGAAEPRPLGPQPGDPSDVRLDPGGVGPRGGDLDTRAVGHRGAEHSRGLSNVPKRCARTDSVHTVHEWNAGLPETKRAQRCTWKRLPP